MATNLVVLAPNGRRQPVKVTPNTTILQIIEEACSKQGFNPEEYDIKHHRKILDTTTIVRFSGLPNNALLELTEAQTVRKETEVVLGLQMEDGSRVMGNFFPTNNLWDVLSKLCPNILISGKEFVIIYMRQELYGDQKLKETDLKSLGITGGRAMLRIIQRSPEQLKTQANISSPLPSKPTEEKPYIRQIQRIPSPERPSQDVPKPDEGSTTQKEEYKETNEDESKPPQMQKKVANINPISFIKLEKRKATHGLKTKNQSQQNAKTLKHSAEDFIFLGERNAMLFSLETAKTVRSDDLPDDFFELSISDIKSLFKDIKKQRLELNDNPLMTSAMRELEESKKQLRQLNHYKRAIIRIQFPSHHVLQGIFTPIETIEDVMNFVKDYLEDTALDFYLFTTPPKEVLTKSSRLIEINCVPGALLHFGSDVKRDTYIKSDLLTKLTSPSIASCAANTFRDENTRMIQDEPEEDIDLKELIAMDTTDVNVGASTSAKEYEDYDNKSPIKKVEPTEKVPKWFKQAK
ncbi:PREDICTED: tether containing UBX domain for GLUT4 [Nicrophorus vespilloides]|uniref:Tether containing UBX domain for GLUT4 n=1 Tax=Nicrophorus vespilloides TaxID=110193 RepID=A0ABM1MV94_NICVS|nr:PREDICTED: tether containing UBX domain for GLUT4 [Nicrophorus vespilloides]